MNSKLRRQAFSMFIARALTDGESVVIIAKNAFMGKTWLKQVVSLLTTDVVKNATDYRVETKGGGRCWVQSAKPTSYAASQHASLVFYLGVTRKSTLDPREFDGIPIPFKDGSSPIVIEC